MELLQGTGLRLLSFDGGGVRGLSSLRILERLMEHIDPRNPPKPCECFDMICGTSTGGLIAIMLGRLKMSVGDCIVEYKKLSASVFTKTQHRLSLGMQVQGRFDHEALERGIKSILKHLGLPEDELMKETDETSRCKTFVCSINQKTSSVVLFPSYYSKSWGSAMLDRVCIWEAARATSAATSFFEPITIDGQTYADGATGANNPIFELWSEALSMFCGNSRSSRLEDEISCLVSIGTGMPSLKTFGPGIKEVAKALKSVAIETEEKWEQFQRQFISLEDKNVLFRFNVIQGLQTVRLEDADRLGDIIAYTDRYCRLRHTARQLEVCASKLIDYQWLRQGTIASERRAAQDGLGIPFKPEREPSGGLDLESYIHTRDFHDWLKRDHGAIMCTTDDPDVALAYRLIRHLGSEKHFTLLYVDCFWVVEAPAKTPSLGRVAELRSGERPARPEIDQVTPVLESLYCQVLRLLHRRQIYELLKTFSQGLSSSLLESFCLCLVESGVPPPRHIPSILEAAMEMCERSVILAVERICMFQELERISMMAKLRSMASRVKVLVGGGSPSTETSDVGDMLVVTQETEAHDCLKSLSFPEMDVRKRQITPALDGTTSWIWTHPVYISFEAQRCGMLWLRGKPGSGKSVLARAIQERLSSHRCVGENSTLLGDWFYHRRRGGSFVKHESLIRSVLFHFLRQKVDLFGEFFRDSFRRMASPSATWELQDLIEIFKSICGSSHRLVCVIDAVDEAENTEVVQLLQLALSPGTSRTRVILLSRPNVEIERQVTPESCIVVEQENTQDIQKIVEAGLDNAQRMIHSLDFETPTASPLSTRSRHLMRRAPPRAPKHRTLTHAAERETSILVSMRESLLLKAQGSILWVKLVLDKLSEEAGSNHCWALEELQQVINDVPEELNQYYRQISQDLTSNKSPRTVRRARQALMWISAIGQVGEVTLDSLWEALALMQDNCQSDSLDSVWDKQIPVSSYDELRRKVHYTCGPFVEVLNTSMPTETSRFQTCGPNSVVQLMHQTVRDFLCSGQDAAGPLGFTLEEAVDMAMHHLKHYLALFIKDSSQVTRSDSSSIVDRLNEHRLLQLALQDAMRGEWPTLDVIRCIYTEGVLRALCDPVDELEGLLRRLLTARPIRPRSIQSPSTQKYDLLVESSAPNSKPRQGHEKIALIFYRACIDGLSTAASNMLALGWPICHDDAASSLAAVMFAIKSRPDTKIRAEPLEAINDTPVRDVDKKKAEGSAGGGRSDSASSPQTGVSYEGSATWVTCSWVLRIRIPGRAAKERTLTFPGWDPYLNYVCGSKSRELWPAESVARPLSNFELDSALGENAHQFTVAPAEDVAAAATTVLQGRAFDTLEDLGDPFSWALQDEGYNNDYPENYYIHDLMGRTH